MRKMLAVLVVLGLLIPNMALALDVLDVDQSRYVNGPSFIGYVQDRFIVVLKDNVTVNHESDMRAGVALSHLEGFNNLANKYNLAQLKPQFPGSDRIDAVRNEKAVSLARHYKVYINSGTLDDAMADYSALPDVERVEPIGIHALYATPNDPYYVDPPGGYAYDQWHYWDTYGIEADMAWNDEAGSNAVLVGDLDIGLKYDHGDIGGSNPPGPNDASTNGNVWVNTNEIPGNGTDDDGNGYVDDIIGWDFVERTNWYSYPCIDLDCGGADNDPWDGDGHGTHTAGTIAAITNNGYAVAGLAGGYGDGTFAGGGNGVKIVPCRIGYVLDYWIYGATGVVIMDYVAEAMYYMGDLKASGWNVAAINCSFGSSNTGGLAAACDYLLSQDVMVIVAAGNSGSSSPDYLGSRTDCLDVGATDKNGNPASFSNYGSWVEVAAPGVAVLSTITDPTDPGSDYVAPMDGTSMSCPHVVGVAALLESYNPALTGPEKFAIITDVANTKPYNQTKDVGVGIVDARKCLDAAGPSCNLNANFSGTPTSGCAPLSVNFTNLSTGTGIDGWSWTFGDGGSSTAQNPNHTYNSPGTYTVSLTVSSSSQGCDDTETKTGYITVNGGPTAGFVGSPTTGIEPLTVNFTDQSTNVISWDWDFGDGGTSTAQSPSHVYSAGTYTVTLTATNTCGSDVETKTNYITVDPCIAPVAAFTGMPTSGEAPLTVNFTDQSSGNPTSWSWNFGDGGTSTSQNPSHEYTSSGTYTVTLTATNACGSDGETKTDYITVTCTAPVADFVGSPTSGDAPLTVDFTDFSSNNPTSWSWNFGDGGTSTAQNPSHQYTAEGIYTVTLTVTNSCGSDGETKTDYITVTQPSIPYASLPYSTGFESGSFDQYWFTQSSNSEGRIQITSANSPRGSYHLTMDDNLNGGQYAQNEAWLRLNLAGSGDVDLVFWWKEFSDENHTQDGVFFSDNGGSSFSKVYDLTGGSSTYQEIALDLDQLAASAGLSLTGTFVVKFQQYDNYGITTDGMAFDDISVTSNDVPPVANFSGTPTSGIVPLTVNFTDLSSGNPTSWSWNFGDGGTSTAQNPNHEYTATGTYTVTLTATNAFGSDDEVKTDYITVTNPPPPTAEFTGTPTSGDYPLTVNFTDQSTGGPTSWDWSFGDGGTSTAQNPSYEYANPGVYTVSLTATNAYGSDTETKTDYITVTDPGSQTWQTITYDDFEGGWGTYTDGGGDCALYTGGTYAHQGSNAADIQDNSGTASSFYHTGSYNVTGYVELEVDFWFIAISMDNVREDFWVQYYDGSTWQTVATYARTTDFDNGVFYHKVVTISSGSYNFPANARLRFMCDASNNRDDVYIDEVEFRGLTSGTSGFAKRNPIVPDQFSISQNYPNPFNPTTTFTYSLPVSCNVNITVYNILGQEVKTLVDGWKDAGIHQVTFDAGNASSGVYFYRIVADQFIESKKMLILK